MKEVNYTPVNKTVTSKKRTLRVVKRASELSATDKKTDIYLPIRIEVRL